MRSSIILLVLLSAVALACGEDDKKGNKQSDKDPATAEDAGSHGEGNSDDHDMAKDASESGGPDTGTPTAATDGSAPIVASDAGTSADAAPPAACKSNAQCSGATPICDTATNKCVGCVNEADCAGTALRTCNQTTHACDRVCNPDTHACQAKLDAGVLAQPVQQYGASVANDAALGRDRQRGASGGQPFTAARLSVDFEVLGVL
jgi:hypothetical protein